MSQLKIFDRDPVKYRQEHASVTSEAERIRPMFADGGFNRNTFNQVFEHFRKPDTVDVNSTPAAMLSSRMPAYAYAMDGGQTMLRSDREFNGSTQFEHAYNTHLNPNDYTESLMEKCKQKNNAKEKALSHAEIQSRLSKRGASFNIPKGAKPDFTKPVENNSMIQEEEPPAAPLNLDEIPIPTSRPQFPYPPQFQKQQQFLQNPPQFDPRQPQFQNDPRQPQFLHRERESEPEQPLHRPPPQIAQILPIDAPAPPVKHKNKKPPIYNRSALTVTKAPAAAPVSEVAELKKLIRKQEEQIARLLASRDHLKY